MGRRVYVSADMEGTAGVTGWEETHPGDLGYGRSLALMTGEVRAAVEGATAQGADHVLVNDSHDGMRNLGAADLPPYVRLLSGAPKRYSMVEGAQDGSFDVAFFTGYHAAAGRPGTLAHTFTLHLREVRVNGELVPEAYFNAGLLGRWGTPVGLVTGDAVLGEDIARLLPWAVFVPVKWPVGHTAAQSLSASSAQERIREGAEEAMRRLEERRLSLFRPQGPFELEIAFDAPDRAERASFCPRTQLLPGDRVRYVAEDFEEVFLAMRALTRLGT
jgi:D-amino peptidase